jgi:hypothetical protein
MSSELSDRVNEGVGSATADLSGGITAPPVS